MNFCIFDVIGVFVEFGCVDFEFDDVVVMDGL